MSAIDDDFGAEWTTEQLKALSNPWAQLTLTDVNEDMLGMNRFMSDTVAINSRAIELKNQWINWWNKLTWNEKNISTATFDEARNRMQAFQIANTANNEEAKAIKEVISRAVTTEEMEGKGRRSIDTGFFPDAPKEDSEKPFFPPWVKVGAGIALLGGTALGIAKIVGGFNPLTIAARFVK